MPRPWHAGGCATGSPRCRDRARPAQRVPRAASAAARSWWRPRRRTARRWPLPSALAAVRSMRANEVPELSSPPVGSAGLRWAAVSLSAITLTASASTRADVVVANTSMCVARKRSTTRRCSSASSLSTGDSRSTSHELDAMASRCWRFSVERLSSSAARAATRVSRACSAAMSDDLSSMSTEPRKVICRRDERQVSAGRQLDECLRDRRVGPLSAPTMPCRRNC